MRKENNPVVSDELMEVDGALGRLCVEVGGNCSKAKTECARD
jgi:hypothetical protein